METSIPADLLIPLQREGSLVFPSNRSCLPDPSGAGVHGVRQPSGHVVYYGPHGRRILATDPEGTPLHECEWSIGNDGEAVLEHARIQLDWGQWVGLSPGGMVHSTILDLSTKPGWQAFKADDLRRMAAQAIGVGLDEVRFFYTDEDLVIDHSGRATIRHRKDAFYVLEDGTFQRARFMACMGAMHWARIDFLPVVELFQSLLPGTGSATLELIRGLYDDQNPGDPLALRYRGVPTYPSAAAYRLFSAFFLPSVSGTGDPFPVFMEPARSHEVTWLPQPALPVRFFDPGRHLCVTITSGKVEKLTMADDPSGLSYVAPSATGFTPCDRRVTVADSVLELKDGERRSTIASASTWGKLIDSPKVRTPTYPASWRSLLEEPTPEVDFRAAFSAVLFYPEDGTEIDELASHAFVADHLQDLLEENKQLADHLARAGNVLIDNFDGAVTSCLQLDRPRRYTILFGNPAFAQKHAQSVWGVLARSQHLDWAPGIKFKHAASHREEAYRQSYELIYLWVSLSSWNDVASLAQIGNNLARALKPGGLAFLVGSPGMGEMLGMPALKVIYEVSVESLPSFSMHRAILPQARLRPGLTLFFIVKAS